MAHDDNKDKDFELEMTWVRKDGNGGHGATKGMVGNGWIHEEVPKQLLDEADAAARKAIEGDDDEDEEEDKDKEEKTTTGDGEKMEED